MSMLETFTVNIKGITSDKVRSVKIKAMDHYLAHKDGLSYYNELKEDIINIKDSKGNEVYTINGGFIFTS